MSVGVINQEELMSLCKLQKGELIPEHVLLEYERALRMWHQRFNGPLSYEALLDVVCRAQLRQELMAVIRGQEKAEEEAPIEVKDVDWLALPQGTPVEFKIGRNWKHAQLQKADLEQVRVRVVGEAADRFGPYTKVRLPV